MGGVMIDKSFSAMIHNKRMELGFTVRDLAKNSGVSFTYISSLENNNENKVPSGKIIKKIAGALSINFYDLQEAALNIPSDKKTFLNPLLPEDVPSLRLYYRLRSRFKGNEKEFQKKIRKAFDSWYDK